MCLYMLDESIKVVVIFKKRFIDDYDIWLVKNY